ncbi:MAG: hypothetical protein STSR0002_04210 [Smithella sp.]|jgi:hypothetical protein
MTDNAIKNFFFPKITKRYLLRVAVVAITACIIFKYVFIPFRIQGESMAPNYVNRDLSIELEDLKIESIQVPQARAIATAYIKATDAYGQRNDQALALEFNLQKVEKKWLVTAAKEIQVLER